MYNQLFHTKPSNELIFQCLTALGFTDLNDHTIIPRINMDMAGTASKFTNLLPKLIEVYIPCKFDLFCNKSLDTNACITIRRQLLKTIDYDLVSHECTINCERMQKYELMTTTAKKIRKKSSAPETQQRPVIVSFN
jgi:hypothetical protein